MRGENKESQDVSTNSGIRKKVEKWSMGNGSRGEEVEERGDRRFSKVRWNGEGKRKEP